LALGTSPVTPLEMVNAYSTIASLGEYRPPIFVTRITDRNGNVLARFASQSERVLSDKTVENLTNMLRGAVDQGTGQAIRTRFGIRADVAGKTGTTQKNTDGWFILIHRRLVAGAWVGFNDSRITMRSNYWGEGAHNALLLVGDFFQQTLSARLIDAGAEFPFERPRDPVWEPYFDSAKEWLGGILDWVFGESAKPAPPPRRRLEREIPRDRFDDPEEQRKLENQLQKERLMERLRQKREQYEREQIEKEVYR
jgi:penicillin-binding protein 1A